LRHPIRVVGDRCDGLGGEPLGKPIASTAGAVNVQDVVRRRAVQPGERRLGHTIFVLPGGGEHLSEHIVNVCGGDAAGGVEQYCAVMVCE
jgi:hypothetical protein